ncbi:hypothetical protein [Thalassotalea fusca]
MNSLNEENDFLNELLAYEQDLPQQPFSDNVIANVKQHSKKRRLILISFFFFAVIISGAQFIYLLAEKTLLTHIFSASPSIISGAIVCLLLPSLWLLTTEK